MSIYKSHHQLTRQPVTPSKHPPIGLKFIKAVEDGIGKCRTMCHYKGVTYVGQTTCGTHEPYGIIYRMIQQGKAAKAFITLATSVNSLLAFGDRLYCLIYGEQTSTMSVYGLCDGRLLANWKHPSYRYAGQRVSVINNDQLAVGDWKGKQIIIYSLKGDVIRRVPLPDCLTMKTMVCMSSCRDDSVVISDKIAGKVVRISLKDGSLIWSSDRVTKPCGVVHHPAGYILVSRGYRDHVVISVLDGVDGIVYYITRTHITHNSS